MPTKRTNTEPNLENLEAAHNEQPPPLSIPPGADISVRFKAPVDPSNLINDSRYPDELATLAADVDEDEPELDPVIAFVTEWSRYDGYLMHVTRLPDPGNKRVPGQTYNRTCLEVESLGTTTFDPRNFEGTLQLVNSNSGGVFRVWLLDSNGRPIPGAHLSRIAVNDPLNLRKQEPAPPQYIAPPKHEPSPMELRLQGLQERLLENALTRLMSPPEPPAAPTTPTMSDEDRLYLMLAREGNMLQGVVTKLTTLASASENAATRQTWSEWLQETGGQLLREHPEIGERVMNTAANLAALILNRFPGTPRQSQAQPVQPIPQLRAIPNPAPVASITDLPEVPNADDDPEPEPFIDKEAELENATMIVIEELIALLSDTEPLRANHPVFIKLNQEYPIVFQQAITMIAQYPLDPIIAWIKTKGPLYAKLLSSPATGPHLRTRLQKLKTLITTDAKTQSNSEPAPAS
jgi:hypothetical protein